jgi:hypothetical protein
LADNTVCSLIKQRGVRSAPLSKESRQVSAM